MWKGYNCTIFAYGQTGSGKTYTMLGDGHEPGFIQRLALALFQQVEQHRATHIVAVEASFMQIYNERATDLLVSAPAAEGLRLREHPVRGPYVENLTSRPVRGYADLAAVIERGRAQRTVGSTRLNAVSSRSHAVLALRVTQSSTDPATDARADTISIVNLVDLAGSERVSLSDVSGERLKESAKINVSLSALGRVITALSDGREFVPYRDSVLTWLLRDSLGGNAKTVMIATVSPASVNYEETLNTLRYASRAKKIVNEAVVNEDPSTRLIRALRQELAALRLDSPAAAHRAVSREGFRTDSPAHPLPSPAPSHAHVLSTPAHAHVPATSPAPVIDAVDHSAVAVDHAALVAQIRRLQETIAATENENAMLRENVDSEAAERVRMHSEQQALSEELKGARQRNKQLHSQFRIVAGRLKDAGMSEEHAREVRTTLAAVAHGLEGERGELEARVAGLAARVGALEGENGVLTARLRASQAEAGDARETAKRTAHELRARVAALQAEIVERAKDAAQRVESAQAEALTEARRAGETQTMCEALEDALREAQAAGRTLQTALRKRLEGVRPGQRTRGREDEWEREKRELLALIDGTTAKQTPAVPERAAAPAEEPRGGRDDVEHLRAQLRSQQAGMERAQQEQETRWAEKTREFDALMAEMDRDAGERRRRESAFERERVTLASRVAELEAEAEERALQWDVDEAARREASFVSGSLRAAVARLEADAAAREARTAAERKEREAAWAVDRAGLLETIAGLRAAVSAQRASPESAAGVAARALRSVEATEGRAVDVRADASTTSTVVATGGVAAAATPASTLRTVSVEPARETAVLSERTSPDAPRTTLPVKGTGDAVVRPVSVPVLAEKENNAHALPLAR